jgi:hypothetical protein
MADGAFPLVLLDLPGLSPHVEGCGGRVKINTADQHELTTINFTSTKTFSNHNIQ